MLGAWQNRLEYTIANLDNAAENLQAAESRIRDVDMAYEMMHSVHEVPDLAAGLDGYAGSGQSGPAVRAAVARIIAM